MNKSFLFMLLLVFVSSLGHAQCTKKTMLYSSKTEYLNSSFEVDRTVEEHSVIEMSKTELVIAPGGADSKMTGLVKSFECNWTTPYKEGKTVMKAALSDPHETKKVTITLEGKNGKLTLLVEVDDDPGKKIRVAIDKFEEKG